MLVLGLTKTNISKIPAEDTSTDQQDLGKKSKMPWKKQPSESQRDRLQWPKSRRVGRRILRSYPSNVGTGRVEIIMEQDSIPCAKRDEAANANKKKDDKVLTSICIHPSRCAPKPLLESTASIVLLHLQHGQLAHVAQIESNVKW